MELRSQMAGVEVDGTSGRLPGRLAGLRQSWYTTGWEKKAAVSGYKSLFYNLILH